MTYVQQIPRTVVNEIPTFDVITVLTSMTRLATTTARSEITFITRKTLRMMYPGPARDFVESRGMVQAMLESEPSIRK